ncbi:MAG: hypothetical protein E7214_06290 [Clostridium sp.]|nr:hypothetical protein [Clostridium sp.]
MKVNLLEKTFEIHYHEVGKDKKVHFFIIINFLQDIFVKQLETKNIGVDYLYANSETWIVSKWDISISKYPIYKDKIKVKTYPISIKKYFLYVKYEIFDENYNLIMNATALWMLVDLKDKKFLKLDQYLHNLYHNFDCIGNDAVNMDKLKTCQNISFKENFNISHSDFDTNGHVNNSKYISWALDTIPDNIRNDYELIRIQVNYKKEITTKQNVVSAIEAIPDYENNTTKFIHTIYINNDVIVAILETIWKPKVK